MKDIARKIRLAMSNNTGTYGLKPEEGKDAGSYGLLPQEGKKTGPDLFKIPEPLKFPEKDTKDLPQLTSADQISNRPRMSQTNTSTTGGGILGALSNIVKAHQRTKTLSYFQGTGNWDPNVNRALLSDPTNLENRKEEYRKVFQLNPDENPGHFDYFSNKRHIEENLDNPEQRQKMLNDLDSKHSASPINRLRRMKEQQNSTQNSTQEQPDVNSDEFKMQQGEMNKNV